MYCCTTTTVLHNHALLSQIHTHIFRNGLPPSPTHSPPHQLPLYQLQDTMWGGQRMGEEGIGGEGRRSEGQEKVKKCYTYIVI